MNHKLTLISIAMAATVLASLFTAVSSAASVSAAQVSSANVQALAPGVAIAGAPAVCSRGANSIDLFVRGSDNALWWKHWDGTAWSASTSLGANLTSDPTVAATNNSLTVAARGVDGALWRINSYNGTWSNWTSVGGQLLVGTGPTSDLNSFGEYAYGWFVTGTDHALYGWNLSGGRWQNLGGNLTSSPAATAPTSDTVTVAARGVDGALWRINSYNGTWSNWTSVGGRLLAGTGPTEFSWIYEANPSVGTFVTGTNHALYYYWWSTGWSNLGGYLTSSPGAAASPDASGHGYYIDVFARGVDGALWWKTTSGAPSGASWSAWMSAGGI
jgi:hypothetical protein